MNYLPNLVDLGVGRTWPNQDNSPLSPNRMARPVDSKRTVGPLPTAATDTSTIIRAQQEQVLAELPLSDAEQAFVTLFDLTWAEYAELKRRCGLEDTDTFQGLRTKVTQAKVFSGKTNVVKRKIDEFEEYQKVIDYLKSFVYASPAYEQVETEENKIIARAFSETLTGLKDELPFKKYFAILEKYHIFDPLNITREMLDEMSVYEETIFTAGTRDLRKYALANLKFEELQQYLYIQEQVERFVRDDITQIIAQNYPESVSLRTRDLEANRILAGETEDKIPEKLLNALTAEARSLVTKYWQAAQELKNALQTPQLEDEAAVQARIEAVRLELIAEVENEYQHAFIDTPTEPEKKALKALFMATAELEILDDKMRFYARLANPVLSQDEREIIFQLRAMKEKGFDLSRTNVDPVIYQSSSIDDWIDAYPAEARAILTRFVAALRADLQAAGEKRSLIAAGQEKSAALYYALILAGFSTEELLVLEAMVGYEALDNEFKALLAGDVDNQIKTVLDEFRRISELANSADSTRLNEEEKKNLKIRFAAISLVLAGLAGSLVKFEYLYNLGVLGKAFGGWLNAQYSQVEQSPEPNDDWLARHWLERFFSIGADQFGLDSRAMLVAHIFAREVRGEPIDQEFISEILKYSSFYYGLMGLDGAQGLDEFKQEFISLLTYDVLEDRLEVKPKFEASKAKMLNWIETFIQGIQVKIDRNLVYAGSEEMRTSLAIVSSINNLLLETKLMAAEELDQFFADHPIVPAREGITTRDFKQGGIYHTVGLENIPSEVRAAIAGSPLADFCAQHSDLLNIYWVPKEPSATFGGYAVVVDKNTIVVVYQAANTAGIKMMANVLIHELRHKVDSFELAQYRQANPDYELPFTEVPLMITERNAYIDSLLYYENLPAPVKKQKEVAQWLNTYRGRVAKANIMLGLPESDRAMIQPPYTEVDLTSMALDIDPADILLNLPEVRLLGRLLDRLGYAGAEKQYLLERCVYIAHGGEKFDLHNDIKIGRRNIFTEFIGRLLGAKTDGLLTDELAGRMNAFKTEIKEKTPDTMVTPYFLEKLILDYAKKNKISVK
ncbi:MAG: hypothetical protein PHH14_06400 [Candidatus Margulisbacteria bacterium]|nr:hypothetical protein [Candidatus Margulisiibacteriota bacterium]